MNKITWTWTGPVVWSVAVYCTPNRTYIDRLLVFTTIFLDHELFGPVQSPTHPTTLLFLLRRQERGKSPTPPAENNMATLFDTKREKNALQLLCNLRLRLMDLFGGT